ncbi:hypothetical protein ACT3SZ_15405 [Corynebacterium sp. AOP40-9SA-29]|uniref:hypothetical protein n=1 Tax=Corynebacterium sp. AOP40-9SA-29 TaxID=3457677 RepID=UPI004033E9AD
MLTDVADTAIRTTQGWSQLTIPAGAGGDIRIGDVVAAGGLSSSEYALLVCLAVLLSRPDEAPGDFAAAYEQLDAADQLGIASVLAAVAGQTRADEDAAAEILRRDLD